MRFWAIIDTPRRGAAALLAAAALFLASALPAKAIAYQQGPTIPPTVYLYDLSPTLAYDHASEPARNNAWAEANFVAALQGLANRGSARLYVTYVTTEPTSPGNIDKFWFGVMRAKGGWIENSPTVSLDTIEALAAKFRDCYRGVVLYDFHVPATSNVASTVAGCENLLPIPYDTSPGSLYNRLVVGGPKLPVIVRLVGEYGESVFTGAQTGSAKCDAYLWAKRRYLDTGICDPTKLAYYVDSWALTGGLKHQKLSYDQFTLVNHDYFVAHKAFFFDLSPWADERPQDEPDQPTGADFRTLIDIFDSAAASVKNRDIERRIAPVPIMVAGFVPWQWKYTSIAGGSNHEPVSAEWRMVSIISSYNAYLDADAPSLAAMANSSFFMHYPLKSSYPQQRLTARDWRAAGYLDAKGRVLPWTFVTFYAGDYDSSAWLYQNLPRMWRDLARGTVPIGWPFNPNLSDRFPLGFDWAIENASPKDFFIAGDSGAGYLNPGLLDGDRPFSKLPSGVDLWAAHCKKYFKKFDITITDVIDGDAPTMSPAALAAYARFAPDGLIGQKFPAPYGFVPNTKTPFIRIDGDLSASNDGADAVSVVQDRVAGDDKTKPSFHVFRTILWTPTQHRNLFHKIEQSPRVIVVDPYTFMALLRQHLLKHDAR